MRVARPLQYREVVKSMRRKVAKCLVPGMLLALALSGCGPAAPEKPIEDTVLSSQGAGGRDETIPTTSYASDEEKPAQFQPYQPPAFADSAFHADHAQGKEQAKLDLEHIDEGYIGVSVQSDKKVKLQVLIGEEEIKYIYDVPSDGSPVIFPLGEGDNIYSISVMENVKEKTYRPIYTAECQVELKDEFQPFLRPSAYSDYDTDSRCVRLAAELASKEEDALGVVGAVFEYVCDNITYDRERAESIKDKTITSYMPVLDDILDSGKGICFDYAALVAAMLRSQGIPTKIVFGDVSPDDVYHAWNMFYTEETGWVTVEYEVKADSWNRLDLTFSANGADSSFIGDGSNYLDIYYY